MNGESLLMETGREATPKTFCPNTVMAHNLGQIGLKQVGTTEACSQHAARSDDAVEIRDGLKCGPLLTMIDSVVYIKLNA